MLQTGRSGLELVLLLVGLVGVSSHEVVDMCGQLRDGLGAVACADVLQWGAKGFRLTGTLTEPLRYAGLGFDDNIAGGATPGAMNVCMLAAFGNGGVIPESCVPTTGTAADEWNGRPEIHYFGMLGFDCGFNFRAFVAGESINWDFPTGNTCVGDVDLDVGLTSLTCMFDMACELGTTTTTTAAERTSTSTTTLSASTSATGTTTSVTTSRTVSSSTASTSTSATARWTTSTRTWTQTTLTATSSTSSITTTRTSQTPTSSTATSSPTPTLTATTSATWTSTITATATDTTSTASRTTTSSTSSTSTTRTTRTATATATSTSASLTRTPLMSVPTTSGAPAAQASSAQASTTWTDEGNETELCLEVPLVQNSADLTYCWGLPHGSACDVRCADGYARDANASLAVCQDGVWQIQGECLREGLEVVQSAAVQVLLQVSLDLPKASNYSTSLRWAQTHEDALYWAFARTLAVHPSELRLELQPAAPPGFARRLRSSVVAFAVRLTALVEGADLDVTARELESLSAAQEMDVFASALAEELYSDSGVVGNISATASVGAVATIERYVLPAPSWWVKWDDAACGACGGQEVGEVLCSRGPWLACLGPNSPAGPQPVASRSCPPCLGSHSTLQLPIWFVGVLSTFALLGCFCSLALGILLGRRCLQYVARVEPGESEDDSPQLSFRSAVRKRPSSFLRLPVQLCWTDRESQRGKSCRKFSDDFSDAEPGLMQHISTLQMVSLNTSKSEEESDMAKLSTMFVQKDSTDVSEDKAKSPAEPPPPPKGQGSPKSPSRPRSCTLLDGVDLR